MANLNRADSDSARYALYSSIAFVVSITGVLSAVLLGIGHHWLRGILSGSAAIVSYLLRLYFKKVSKSTWDE